MKDRNAIKKVKSHFKKQGIDIEVKLVGHRWTFVHAGYVGSFLANGCGSDEDQMDADAHNFHVRGVNDHSDLMTDYHAGSFRDNITQVCESLLPPAPKFPAGSLVRGKQTKRAIRQGYAGKVGLVMEARANDFARIAWTGEDYNPRGAMSYPMRDLEAAT